MQVLEVPEEVQSFLERGRTSPRVLFGRERVDAPLAVDANRRHLADRSIERARLTPSRIFGEVDALAGERSACPAECQNC
jgi:hypothetical protein